MGVVDLLPAAPRHRLPGRRLAGDLRVAAGQPWRGGVGRRTKNDFDAALVGTIEHRREPIQVKLSVLWLPGGPDGFPDPDDREASFGHQVQVGVQPWAWLVLVVVGGAEQHLLAGGVHDGAVLSKRSGLDATG